MSINSISSVNPRAAVEWPEAEAAPQIAYGGLSPQPRRVQGSADFKTVTNVFGKFTGYLKRIGWALLGKNVPAPENKVQSYSVPTRIKEEVASNEPDPLVGRWPSNLLSNENIAPPPRAAYNVQQPQIQRTTQDDFKQVMAEMAQSENEQKAAYNLLKGGGAEALLNGASDLGGEPGSGEGASLGL
jgi:hypothetical protein